MNAPNSPYEDILHLPRPVSAAHPPMPMEHRAAQFAPFAALRGYDKAIAEAGRRTQTRMVLHEDEITALNAKLQRLDTLLPERPAVSITYFQPDERKEGGAYVTVTGVVGRIDLYQRVLRLTDGALIPIQEIVALQFQETAALPPDCFDGG